MVMLPLIWASGSVPVFTKEILDAPFHKNVLVSNDSLTDAICLVFDASVSENNISRNNRSFELEGHLRRRKESICCPNIVQKT